MGVRGPTPPVANKAAQVDEQCEEHSADRQRQSERHETDEHAAREALLSIA